MATAYSIKSWCARLFVAATASGVLTFTAHADECSPLPSDPFILQCVTYDYNLETGEWDLPRYYYISAINGAQLDPPRET